MKKMLAEMLKNRLKQNNIKEDRWRMGYTDDDVERVIPVFEKFMKENQLKGTLYMVWEHYDDVLNIPMGDSSLWIVSGDTGAEIGMPLLEEGSVDRFIEDMLMFHEDKMKTTNVSFEPVCGEYNAV